MVSTGFVSALAAAASLLSLSAAQSISVGEAIPTPTVSVTPNAFTEVGCFSDPDPLVDHGSYNFQSIGNCQMVCVMLNKPVMGLTGGTNCSCGDMIPPVNSQVDNGTCSTSCAGFDKQNCGGANTWWVVLTGTTRNKVANFVESSSSASQSQTQVTVGGSTVVVMTTPTAAAPTQSQHKSSGANKAGIAAGVVVGIVVLAAIVGAVVFYLRQKRRKDVEEEYRRQAQVNSFASGGKLHTSHSSMTDSRLDPEFAARRGSSGSIADNADYSRRILQVTNPDGR